MNIAAILFDLGDVIMREETEVKDAEGNTQSADLVDGMGDALRTCKASGYKLALVADTRPKTAWNVLHQHNLYHLFDAFAISEEVGVEKPDPRIFTAALDALAVPAIDYAHVLMIGNNPARDICGANTLGLISVWFHWNDRYLSGSETQERPAHEVHDAQELLTLIVNIEERTVAV
jgi:putative hydrolase of the HAD superfamily